MAKVKKKISAIGRIFIALAAVVALVLAIVIGYVVYMFADYHRIEAETPLEMTEGGSETLKAGEEYTALTYNIGFAAYTPDFGFFMDGGTESRAASPESVRETMAGIAGLIAERDADIMMIEEVDVDATRSYHIDEKAILEGALGGYASAFAVNYDSSYLFYPIFEPHGASYAGMLTFSRFGMEEGIRHSLPVETGFMKFFDLDRCYSVVRIPADNGKELVIYTAHLSAYTSDGTIATEQTEILAADMRAEYEKGNYVICGGDFNKDLLGDSSEYFGVTGSGETWAQPFPEELLGNGLKLVAPTNAPSCRNADGPYNPEQLVLVVDGFIVSDNIEVISAETVDTDFTYSDHDPVEMKFVLK